MKKKELTTKGWLLLTSFAMIACFMLGSAIPHAIKLNETTAVWIAVGVMAGAFGIAKPGKFIE